MVNIIELIKRRKRMIRIDEQIHAIAKEMGISYQLLIKLANDYN